MPIPNPIIYNQNEDQIASDLLPPNRRLPVFLAWLSSLLSPAQWDHDLIFNDYADGSPAPNWVISTVYAYLDRVKYIDGAVYELQTTVGITSTIPPNQDTVNWIKVLDTWIGIRERARYTGQLIMLEYILNKYFQVGSVGPPFTGASHSTQIYIINTFNSGSHFWLSNGGSSSLTSFMANNSIFQKYFLGNAYNGYSQYKFIIHVPVAVAAAIDAQQVPGSGVTYNEVIRYLADKYIQAGNLYNIVTY